MLSDRYLDTTYDFGFIRCVYGFAAGVLTWHAYDRWNGHGAAWVGHGWRSVALEILALSGIICYVSEFGQGWTSLVAPLVFGVAVFLFSFEAGPVSRFLRRGPFLLLGTLSYSIYMIHLFVMFRFHNMTNKWII